MTRTSSTPRDQRKSNSPLEEAFLAAGIKNIFHLKQMDASVLAKRWTSLLGSHDELAETLLNAIEKQQNEWEARLDELIQHRKTLCNPKWMERLVERSQKTDGHDERIEQTIDELMLGFWFVDNTQQEREHALESLVALTNGQPERWIRSGHGGNLAHTAVFALDAEQSENQHEDMKKWIGRNLHLGQELIRGLGQMGVDLEATDDEDQTPLDLACNLLETDHTAHLAIHSLLSADIDLNQVNPSQRPLAAKAVIEASPAWRARMLGQIAERTLGANPTEPARKRPAKRM